MDGGSDTPNADRRAKNGGKGESGSLGEDLARDGLEKLTDKEALKDGLKANADSVMEQAKGGFKLFAHAAECAGKCALSEIIGDDPKSVAGNIFEETTTRAMDKGFKEADWTKGSKALDKYSKARGAWTVGAIMWCTAACPGPED